MLRCVPGLSLLCAVSAKSLLLFVPKALIPAEAGPLTRTCTFDDIDIDIDIDMDIAGGAPQR